MPRSSALLSRSRAHAALPQVDFILGCPTETEDEQLESLAFMNTLVDNEYHIRLHYFMPLPGTPWGKAQPSPLSPKVLSLAGALLRYPSSSSAPPSLPLVGIPPLECCLVLVGSSCCLFAAAATHTWTVRSDGRWRTRSASPVVSRGRRRCCKVAQTKCSNNNMMQ